MADDILKNIPLPADLPENWTSGQIIAPTGAEAGLDNQHGYNYLMKQVNNAQKAATAIAAALLNYVYPVGSLYMSAEATSPAELFGGTWEQIKDRFILAAGDTYAAGTSGGEKEVTLARSQLPKTEIAHKMYGQYTGADDWGSSVTFPNNGVYFKLYSSTGNVNVVNDGGTIQHLMQFNLKSQNDSFGNSQPHNNMPPYIAMYVWKRIA